MPPFALSDKARKMLWGVLLFSLIAQVAVCIFVPLLHDTEARYAEIARKMLETGDWITPRHDSGDSAIYGTYVWFWAKPPLSSWLSAISMKCFGINEFAARLPSLLLEVGMLGLVYTWLKKMRDRDFALLAVVVLATSVQCFICFECVMTDPSLAFCSTLSLVSFWMAMRREDSGRGRLWGWLFFVGLGAGLLAKGPLVGVLVVLPLAPWLLWHGKVRQAWDKLPWIGGTLLMLAIAMPWYIAAEIKTPGFLKYFIVGEHLGRFLDPAWSGDRYGHSHVEPIGKIWLFCLTATMPWSLVVLAKMARHAKGWRQWVSGDEGSLTFLVACAFALVVFFTFARNIIWPYCLPAMPFLAALMVEAWRRMPQARPRIRHVVLVAALIPMGMLWVALLAPKWSVVMPRKSGREPVRAYLADRSSPEDALYVYGRRSYSLDFYSAGKIRVLNGSKPTQKTTLEDLAGDGKTDYVLFETGDWDALAPAVHARFSVVRGFDELNMSQAAIHELSRFHSPFELRQVLVLVKEIAP